MDKFTRWGVMEPEVEESSEEEEEEEDEEEDSECLLCGVGWGRDRRGRRCRLAQRCCGTVGCCTGP